MSFTLQKPPRICPKPTVRDRTSEVFGRVKDMVRQSETCEKWFTTPVLKSVVFSKRFSNDCPTKKKKPRGKKKQREREKKGKKRRKKGQKKFQKFQNPPLPHEKMAQELVDRFLTAQFLGHCRNSIGQEFIRVLVNFVDPVSG